jgi:hypothetical protein
MMDLCVSAGVSVLEDQGISGMRVFVCARTVCAGTGQDSRTKNG